MTIKRRSLPTPKQCIRHKRFTEYSGWCVLDLRVSSLGSIAVSGFKNETGQTFIDVYSGTYSSENLKLLYSKEFQNYSDYFWRYITFLERSVEILCGIGDKLELFDIQRDKLLCSSFLNKEITSLCFKNGTIFVCLGYSNEIKVCDVSLQQIKSIQLQGLVNEDYPCDVSASSDKLFVCLQKEWKSLSFNANNGEVITEFRQRSQTVEALEPYSIAINEDLNLVLVLYWEEICLFTLHDGKCFLEAAVDSETCRIRISNEGWIFTCDHFTGEVNIFNLSDIFSYNSLKEHLALTFLKDECIQLANFFSIPSEKIDTSCMSNTFAEKFLLALEEKNILQPFDVKRFKDGLVELNINPSCITVTSIFERSRILPTIYERFLVTLSDHLTASLSHHLLTTFNIFDQKKTRITSSQNTSLSLLLSLDEMGVIGPLNVEPLIQPFEEFNLVQAVATIYGYQTTVKELKDQTTMLHKETQLKVEGKTDVFIQCLKKKIRSWYETMSPVPWKKSCKWKSTDLFVASGLFLTNSKAKNIPINIDDQCKLEYTEILTNDRLKDQHRIILEGEPGSGKTMLLSQLAYDWCQGKFSDIKVLILLPLKFVQHRTIAAAIKDYYVAEDHLFSVDDIHGVLEDSENPSHLLLDGLEEYTGVAHAGKQSELVQIISKVKYPYCKAVVSSRSDYAQNLPECPTLRLGKFGEAERNLYVKKVLGDVEDEHLEINRFIKDSSFILDFCSVPLLFVMTVHNLKHMLWLQKSTFDMVSPFMKGIIEILSSAMAPTDDATRRHNVNTGTNYLQQKGAEHGKEIEHNRPVQSDASFQSHETGQFDSHVRNTLSQQAQDLETAKYLTNNGSGFDDDHLLTIEELAFNGLCRGVQQLSWQREFVEQNVKNSRHWISSGILVVTEEVQSTLNFNTTASQLSQLVTVPENSSKPPNTEVSLETDSLKSSYSLKRKENDDVSFKADHPSGHETFYETSTGEFEPKQKQGMLDDLTEVILRSDFEKLKSVKDIKPTTKKKHDSYSENYELHTESDTNTDGAKDVTILSKVSFQVKFLHKLIQEWFAANHFSSMLWKSTVSQNLQECVKQNIPYISPSDLHYILRFTCYLCPPSFHLIGKYLLQMHHTAVEEQQECILDCIFLCFVEYNGENGADFFDFLAAICQETINVRSGDSRLLQKAKCGVMELASKHRIPIREVLLTGIIMSARENFITFNSGILMSPLDTLKTLEISRWDQFLKDDEFPCIMRFISQCYSLQEARLHFPHQPPKVDTETVNILRRENIKVTWIIGTKLRQTFDVRSGMWVLSSPLERSPGNVPRQYSEGSKVASIFKIQDKVSRAGGKLQIPETDICLEIPADALGHARKLQMRILPPHSYEKYYTSFASNSTVAVELLPNNLKLKHSVQLTLSHCLKLKKDVEYKAKIFMSHHERNADLHWEEVTDQPYILDETTCTIWLNRFCWVKYEIDDKIVEAKKIKIFTAAKPLCLPDNIAEIEVGYYLDLPGAGEFLQQNPDFVLAQRKSFLFHKEGKFPMKVSLQRVLPSTWHHSAPEENVKEIPFQTVASSIEYSCPFVLEQDTKGCDVPICTFTALQHQRHLELNVRPKPVEDVPARQSRAECNAMDEKMRDCFMFFKKNLAKDWKDFGRYLKVPEDDLSRFITESDGDIGESTYQMLLYWQRRNASEANTEKLVEALKKLNRRDLIEHVMEILS